MTKRSLRTEIKRQRSIIPKEQKERWDHQIYSRFIKSGILRRDALLLIYLSTDIEVGTGQIIEYCLDNSIDVAVPRCTGDRKMQFYYYSSDSILERSRFGIPEPVPEKSIPVQSYDNAVCIVPGLAFDRRGYRLGYGGGFYDSFLSENPGVVTVGICYEENMTDRLPVGEHDRYVNYIITEKNTEVCNER
ncbi:MAG: 5-formyltetrahydrofolate cyclo-ligase [Porcipelethomonas sp.]